MFLYFKCLYKVNFILENKIMVILSMSIIRSSSLKRIKVLQLLMNLDAKKT